MVKFASIVCGTDLSDPSDEALRQALARSEGTGARLAVVRAAPLPYVGGGEVPITLLVDPEQFTKQASEEIRAQLARAKQAAKADVEVLTEPSSEAAAIVRYAESRAADLIVVGSRGSTGLRRMVLGSVAESVVRHAHCSVLVARPAPASGNVLAATDLSESSLRAISTAAEEAQHRQARLTVLHCLDLPPTGMTLGFAPVVPADPADPRSRPMLAANAEQELRRELKGLGVVADVLVDARAPRAAIVEVAERLSAELIVVGTRGRSGLPRMLLGSVAESVVRHAPCSVLVVRAGSAA